MYYRMENISIRHYAELTGIAKSNISRWIIHGYYDENPKVKNKSININKYNDKVGNILQYQKNSLVQNPFKTLDELKLQIIKKFNIVKSRSTLSRYLQIIGLSKKKILLSNLTKPIKELKRQQKEFEKAVKKINKDDIICIDESYINPKIYSNYGWCKIGDKVYKYQKVKRIKRKQSLIMAIGKNEVINYKVIKDSFNSKNYREYIKGLIDDNNLVGKYFLMDNVSFHKTKELRKVVEESGNSILYIPAYSPQYNPIEEVFGYMKSKMRNELSINKLHCDLDVFLIKFIKDINKTDIISKMYNRSFKK